MRNRGSVLKELRFKREFSVLDEFYFHLQHTPSPPLKQDQLSEMLTQKHANV